MAWLLGMAAVLAGASAWAGVISRDMLERRALESLETVYAGGSKAGGSCRAVDSNLEFLTYFLLCKGKVGAEFWMARSRNGEIIDISPLDEAAAARLDGLAPGAPPFENADYVRAARVSASERAQFLRAAKDARY